MARPLVLSFALMLAGCVGGTASVETTPGSASRAEPGPAIDPRCEAGGVVFEETGTNRSLPYESANAEVETITGIVPTGTRIAVARGRELASFARGQSAGRGQLTVHASVDRGVSGGRVEGLSRSDDRLIWFAGEGASWMPLESGTVASASPRASRLAIAGDTVFAATMTPERAATLLMRGPLGGDGAEMARIDGSLTVARHLLAQDGEALFLSTFGFGGAASGVYRVAKSDGKVTKLLPTTSGNDCAWVVVAGDHAIASCVGADRYPRVVRFSKTDGAGLAVVAERTAIDLPVVEDKTLYGFSGERGRNRKLVRVDATTGQATDLVVERPETTLDAFAREGRCFYVATQACTCIEKTTRFNKGTNGTDEVCAASRCTNRIERVIEKD